MRFGTPQIIWLVLVGITLGMHLCKHGEDKNEKFNFFTAGINVGLNALLLYYGGFFG